MPSFPCPMAPMRHHHREHTATMPGSSDDGSVDSLDEWLKGGPSSKKAVAFGAHVVGTSTGDDDDSDLDSVDQEIERMLMKERRERSANKEDTEEKTVDEKNAGSLSGGVESLPESSLSPAAAPAATRANTRTSPPTRQSHRRVAWHHEVDVMERRKRRRRARVGYSRSRNIDSDSDDDDDDDDLLEYARATELSKKRRQEEEAKAEAERASLAAASANADETRQDYCDDGDAGEMEAESDLVKKSTEDTHDEDDIIESDDSDVEIIEESDDDSDEDQYKSPTNHRHQTQRTPSPRKRHADAAAPTLASEVICLDVDSDGDEEIENPTHPLLSSPPPHMDASSWHTVRKIQEQDRKEASGTKGLFSPGFSPAKRKRPATHSTDDVNNDAELARKMQVKEEAAAEAGTKRRRRLTQGPKHV